MLVRRLFGLAAALAVFSACGETPTNPQSDGSDLLSLDVVPAASAPDVFWTGRDGTVNHLDPATGNSTNLVEQYGNYVTYGLAVDEVHEKLYWIGRTLAGSNLIFRANLNGSGMEALFGMGGREHLAIDPVGGKLYWKGGGLQRANFDGSAMETVMESTWDVCPGTLWTGSGGVAFDPVGQTVYFGDATTAGICRVNTDGGGPGLAVGVDAAILPRGIAIDEIARRIYYFGARTSYGDWLIKSANLDGSNVQEVYDVQYGPSELGALAIDEVAGKVYWPGLNTTDNFIKRANLDGTGVEIVGYLPSEALGIAVSRGTTPPSPPDLTLDKAEGGLALAGAEGVLSSSPGEAVHYSLIYENVGGTDGTGVTLTETVPAHTTFNAGLSNSGWSCTEGSPAGTECTLGVGTVVAGGGPATAIFAVTVVQPVPLGVTEINNTASVADDGTNGADPTPGNNEDSETTPLDLSPEDQVETMDQGVTDLDAVLNSGNLNSLHKQLDQVVKKLEKGQTQVAISVLMDFVQHVSDLIARGKLTSVQGQPLVDAANALIADLTG